MTRKLGGSLLDAEHVAALAHLIDARDRVRRKLEPAPALAELQNDLTRCFAIAPQDAGCRTLAAQGEWVQADWLASQGKPVIAILEGALAKALLATQSPEKYPDAWQTLAEAHLRIARLQTQPKVRAQHLADGLAAVAKVFAINPNHALGFAVKGALELANAQDESDPRLRQSAGQAAAQSLEQALKHDPFLTHSYSALLKTARALSPSPL